MKNAMFLSMISMTGFIEAIRLRRYQGLDIFQMRTRGIYEGQYRSGGDGYYWSMIFYPVLNN